jgi:Ni/Co efflux regulator RcnB
MNKVMVILLAAVFAAAGLTTQKATAQEKQEKKEKTAAAAKEARWHGLIVTMDKDKSTLVVRRQEVTRTIYYDSSTKWTEGTKAVEMSEFKEGADVICLGKYDEKGKFHATRIDLHRR